MIFRRNKTMKMYASLIVSVDDRSCLDAIAMSCTKAYYGFCFLPNTRDLPLPRSRRLFVLLLVALYLPLASQAQPNKPAEWKINGTLAALHDANSGVRAIALDSLGRWKYTDEIQTIAVFLNDENSNVRNASLRALGTMGEAAKIYAPKILNMIKGNDWQYLSEMRTLQAMGAAAKDVAPQIAVFLNHENSYFRSAAIDILGAIGEAAKSYAPQIAALLKDEDGNVRYSAFRALGKMDYAAKPYLSQIVASLLEYEYRTSAVNALLTLGEKASDVAPQIAAMLKNQDAGVRSDAVKALGVMGGAAKAYVPQIVALLNDKNWYVRRDAVQTLGTIGEFGKANLSQIAALIKDENKEVRSATIKTVGAMGKEGKAYVSLILALLTDKNCDDDDFSNGIDALGAIGKVDKDIVSQIAALLKDQNFHTRFLAVEALGAMGEAANSYVSQIAALLKDDEKDVRSAAVSVLGAMGEATDSYVPQIVALLKDQSFWVRYTTVITLGDMHNSAGKAYMPQIAALLKDQEGNVRSAAIRTLGTMGEAANSYVSQIAALLKDESSYIRSATAEALGAIGGTAKVYAPKLAALLKEPDDSDADIHSAVITALSAMGPLDITTLTIILSPIYDDASRVDNLRFLAHLLGGGDGEAECLLAWLGLPDQYPEKISLRNGIQTLNAFANAWEGTADYPKVRKDLAHQIMIVTKKIKSALTMADFTLLRKLNDQLESDPVTETYTAAINEVIIAHEKTRWLRTTGRILLVHALFWLGLIFIYPKSPQIQAIFFWNVWVRRLTGLGYVGFALTWVPYFRAKLFAPFKESLLADAALASFNLQAYFEDSELKSKLTGQTQSLLITLPAIKGQVVLEGESGLGKTMFLRHLARQASRIVAYLPAEKCAKGVSEAIQAKLHGQAQDPEFLQNLIYSGAIDICIDGLNEVTADTRAKITEFVERYFKGNIIMTTQPLEWTPPATAKVYVMQPLTPEKIERFLLTRQPHLTGDAAFPKPNYEQACKGYLATALSENHPTEVLAAARRILSNPMDLTTVAQMLADGKSPDLFRLQKQQYKLMAEDYHQVNNSEFPLHLFAEEIYQMRLQDRLALPEDKFFQEIQCMERHKMVVSRQSLDAHDKPTKTWYFRHDKIIEYFIVQTFLGANNERPQKHLGDPRFRGVYFLLALLLPLQEATTLREQLIQYAADTKDHTVSDTFIQILRSRKTV